MKKSHLDKNNTIRILIYFFSFFIFVSILFSFLYKAKVSDFYSYSYEKLFLNKSELINLKEENSNLKNEIQNYKNIILEKNITDAELSSGVIDTVKANKINLSIFNKDIIYSEILLNKGLADGVEISNKVYITGLRPVGVITESNENSSKLKLYSDNNFESEFILKSKLIKTENTIEKNSTNTVSNEIIADNLNSSSTGVSAVNYDRLKDHLFTGMGDGSYGIKIKTPSNLTIKLLDLVYTKDDTVNPVGEVVAVEEIISQKEKEVYVKTYYNSSINSSFYITK